MSTSEDPAVTILKASLRTGAGYRFECTCLRWLHTRLPYLLTGAEKALVDCGLCVDDSLQLPTDYSARLFETVFKNEDVKGMIPLDCKTVEEIISPVYKGGLYYHAIHTTLTQQNCAAFLVFNPRAQQLIAVLPLSYLNHAKSSPALSEVRYHGREIPLTGAPIEPFPLEWSPFVMPIELLPNALDSLHQWCCGSSVTWSVLIGPLLSLIQITDS